MKEKDRLLCKELQALADKVTTFKYGEETCRAVPALIMEDAIARIKELTKKSPE